MVSSATPAWVAPKAVRSDHHGERHGEARQPDGPKAPDDPPSLHGGDKRQDQEWRNRQRVTSREAGVDGVVDSQSETEQIAATQQDRDSDQPEPMKPTAGGNKNTWKRSSHKGEPQKHLDHH